MANALFYALALTTLYGGANVVLRRDPLVGAIHLALALFSLTGIYLLLGFPLLAGLNLLVYAGAVLVFFLFVILLLEPRERRSRIRAARSRLGALVGLVLAVEGIVLAASVTGGPVESAFAEKPGDTGRLLFTTYLFPFEASGLLLVLAVVAVLVLAAREERRGPPSPPVRRLEVPAPFQAAGFPEGRA